MSVKGALESFKSVSNKWGFYSKALQNQLEEIKKKLHTLILEILMQFVFFY